PPPQPQPEASPTPTPTLTPTVLATAAGGTIRGRFKAGTVPLPGVAVTAANTLTGKKYATTTDITGSFAMVIPRNGRYVVKAELAAFATETKEVVIDAAKAGGKTEQVAEFSMQLASRVAQQQEEQAGTASTLAGALGQALGQSSGQSSGQGSGQGRGTQSLNVTGDSDLADASAGSSIAGAQMPTLSGLGSADDAAADSVAVSGQMGQPNGLANFNEDEIRQRVE